MNWLDRFALAVSPSWGRSRIRDRAIAETLARHYEAAAPGRRTTNWPRSGSDANVATAPSLFALRALARDLVRNNAWAKRGLQAITNNTVGWGIVPKAVDSPAATELWRRWGETKQCDADGRRDFYGLQALAMRSVAEAGEVLVRRRPRRTSDGLAIPLQLQLLEADYLDTAKDGILGAAGGQIINGVEFDAIGKRAAYWLFDRHPGSNQLGSVVSRRIPASEIIHVYADDRPGQVRGASWLSTAIVNLRDFDEYEDATLMRQKIAACFAAFLESEDPGIPLGERDAANPIVETIEPGMVAELPPGRKVSFANPPISGDDGFSTRTLRRIAAGIGVTYEDLSGDYSQVNFSSSRMARIAHWGNIHRWRWDMLIPTFCDGGWNWAMDAAVSTGLLEEQPEARWTPPPMPMLEPDREGLALTRLVRAGAMTPSEMVRQQGNDPEQHWDEYQSDLADLDDRGIWLDSDVRRVSAAGLTQERAGLGGGTDSKG